MINSLECFHNRQDVKSFDSRNDKLQKLETNALTVCTEESNSDAEVSRLYTFIRGRGGGGGEEE